MRPLEAANPVAFFYNGIGDHLVSLPAIRAIATLFSKRLRLVCLPLAKSMFFGDLPVRSFIETKISRVGAQTNFSVSTLAQNVGACDVFVSLAPWHSVAIDELLRLIRPRYSIGFSPSFDEVVPNETCRHSADVAFNVPLRLDESVRIDDFSAPPALPRQSILRASCVRQAIAEKSHLLLIHGDTNPEKMWQVEKWRMFLDEILNRYKTLAIFIVGCSGVIADKAWYTDRVFDLSGCSLATSIALVGVADVFVGVDSCMLHAADLFRVPGIGLFGPTSSQKWGFRFTKGMHMQGVDTMESIEVDEVVQAFGRLAREGQLDNQTSSHDRSSFAYFSLPHRGSADIIFRFDKEKGTKVMNSTEPSNASVAERIRRIREKFSTARQSADQPLEKPRMSDFENFVKWEPAFDNSPWHNFGNLSGN